MNYRSMITASALILLPSLAFAQALGGSALRTNPNNPGNSSISTLTPPDSVKSPNAYNGRSSASTMSNEQMKPNSTDMHPSGPDAPSALDAARDAK